MDSLRHEPRTFYIIVREDDVRYKRHLDADAAHAEAERLALKEGRGFYVLRAASKVRLSHPPTEWVSTYEGVVYDPEPVRSDAAQIVSTIPPRMGERP